MQEQRSTKINKKCLFCGKELIPTESGKNQKFCSTACKGKWQSKNLVGERNPNWQGGPLKGICKECRKPFTFRGNRKNTAKFCSIACKGKWQSKNVVGVNHPTYGKPGKINKEKHWHWKGGKISKECEECGKEFTIQRYRGQSARFCSPACHGKWMSKILIGEKHPNWGRIAKICEECGKAYTIPKSREAKSTFCSRSCQAKWMSKHHTGEQIHNWRGGPLSKLCEICDKEFVVERARERTARFCSPKCQGVWISKTNVGWKNPSYTGGPKDYCEKWNLDFRRRIRAFFDYKCVECGTPQNEILLHCHHVYYDKKACCAVNEDEKYYSNLGIKNNPYSFEIIGDPNKFVALCQSCHLKCNPKKDREYWARHFEEIINNYFLGRSYFTKEEFEKFR
jgi:endogenous inhibitor of DNA gyrase (YacG/DUF329 family)